MYAILETGNKQYKVEVGGVIRVEKLIAEVGGDIVFDSVLLIEENGDITVGSPYVSGATVAATVTAQDREKKVIVFKYKPKKGYKKKNGHRQPYTELKITAINKAA
ncbi:50S ribosomal protein L21 [Clostridia bacterium]|nr:50S ribosomal protein L21 [Clostridia bacterium]